MGHLTPVGTTSTAMPLVRTTHLAQRPCIAFDIRQRPCTIRCMAGTPEVQGGKLLDQAAHRFGKGAPANRLFATCTRLCAGLEQGISPDELVARELGKADPRELSRAQDEYRDKIRDKLSERAKQLEAERAQKQRLFTLGKVAYERGNYAASLEFLEQALRDEGPLSQLGGEIQLWLALAYQAEGRETDCIDTYRRVEATHPNPKIRKQAAELRFIMEAPKLAANPDERVQVPVLTNLDINRNAKPAVSSFKSMKRAKRKKTLEEQFLENYQPPDWATNRYVWVASVLVATGLVYYSSRL